MKKFILASLALVGVVATAAATVPAISLIAAAPFVKERVSHCQRAL